METTCVSTDGWVDKEKVMCVYVCVCVCGERERDIVWFHLFVES